VPDTPHLQPRIEERNCANCRGPMRLMLIEPGEPGFDQWLFECSECHHSEQVQMKIDRLS
jgi:hypothetical protein